MPTWFWWADGRLYFITAGSTQKARNLAREPWIVAHFGDGDDVLVAEGPASIVTDPDEKRQVDGAYGDKYVDPLSGRGRPSSITPPTTCIASTFGAL